MPSWADAGRRASRGRLGGGSLGENGLTCVRGWGPLPTTRNCYCLVHCPYSETKWKLQLKKNNKIRKKKTPQGQFLWCWDKEGGRRKGKAGWPLEHTSVGNRTALTRANRPVCPETSAAALRGGSRGGGSSPPSSGPRAESPVVHSSFLSTQRNQRPKPLKHHGPSNIPGVSKPCKSETILPHPVGVAGVLLL